MPNANPPPVLVEPRSAITEVFDSGGLLAIRLASNQTHGFYDGVTQQTVVVRNQAGGTPRNGTYTTNNTGSDGTGDFLITTTSWPGGASGTGGELVGFTGPVLKIIPDTTQNIDFQRVDGDPNTVLVASRASAGGGGGNTLDSAYDQGGSGSGRSITADNGAVTIAGPASAGNEALTVSHDKTDQVAMSVSGGGTNRTAEALNVQSSNLNAATDPVLVVSSDTAGGTLVENLKVTHQGVTGQSDQAAPQITANQTDTSRNAIMQLTTNSKSSTIQQDPSGVLSVTSNATMNVLGTTGLVIDVVSSGIVQAGVTGCGVSLGQPPSTLNTNAASVGEAQVASTERSLVVGRQQTATDNSLAVGVSCTAAVNSIALGNTANASLYTGGNVLAMAANNDVGGTATINTLVLDAAAQIPGAPTAAIAPGSAGPGAGVGNIYLDSGSVYSGGADYAEMFEWNDGNANSADRRGFFVSLVNGNKIEVGNSNVVGVVSSSPAVIGDAADLSWQGKYERDEFGGMVYQMVDGRRSPKPSSTYNPTQSYTPRRGRKEWAPIGLIGKLYVRSAQALTAGSKCSANSSGYAVSGNDYHILRVIRQPTSSKYGIIEILMK